MTRDHLDALCRLLIGSGDMTPMAKQQLLRAYDVSESAAATTSTMPRGGDEL